MHCLYQIFMYKKKQSYTFIGNKNIINYNIIYYIINGVPVKLIFPFTHFLVIKLHYFFFSSIYTLLYC